jgi:hypothetical protein
VHNDFRTFKPYDPSSVVGDTTPNLPVPSNDGGCGGFGQILVIIVAIVVTIYTAGALSGASGAFGEILTSGASFLGGTATAATGTIGMSLGVAGTAAVSAAVGSIASQLVGNAIGVQDGFSWKSVALAAIGGGVTAGLPTTVPGFTAGTISNLVVRGAISNALTQGVAVVTGLQEHFEWRNVAAAAVGAGVGGAVRIGLGDTFNSLGEFGGNAARGTVSGIAAGMAARAVSGGRMNVAQIATDAFGNALGNSIAYGDWGGSQQEEVLGNAIGNSVVDSMRPSYGTEEMAQDFARENARFDRQVAASQMPNENMMGLGSGLDPLRSSEFGLRWRGMTAADLREQAASIANDRIDSNRAMLQAQLVQPPEFDPVSGKVIAVNEALPKDAMFQKTPQFLADAGNWVMDKAQSTWSALGKIEPEEYAILSPKNAKAAAQYWADRQVATGNPLYGVPGALAAAWAEHPDEVGMILSMGRGGNRGRVDKLGEIGSTELPMLGANGTRTASTTIWKGVGKERIDVENPNPGQRPGQLHYQDNAGNKYLYDPKTNSFPDAPNAVNRLLENQKFMQALDKGMKRYLGEK